MAREQKILVVNGDDFGLSKGINRGIESAFHRGILRSTSLMPNGDAFDDAVEIALRTPGLGVGVHLSLVGEQCVAEADEVRGLAGAHNYLPASYAAFVWSYLTGRFGTRQIRAEIQAQIKRVIDSGITPTHLDSHQHLHVLPGFTDAVIDAAKSAGIGVVRAPLESASAAKGSGARRRAEMVVLRYLSARCKGRLRRAGIKCADSFFGIGVSGRMNGSNLARTLGALQDGVNEIMCHPGFADPATEAKYHWNYAWDEEVGALTSEDVKRAVDVSGVRLASFADAFT